MSFLRAFLIKKHRMPPEWAAQYTTSQLWHWHVTGKEPTRR
ncbi:hypothetical protein QFZ75_007963 [Streptomyces sp. V3I8]|nr:hypothetical protein [Streptomyces sp. V3I8]MDQ1041461.1 hypothetical protein [Streptomyces sp. V3I8]